MADYLPHTGDEVASMLDFLGLATLDELFSQIPVALRLAGGLSLDDGMSEPDVAARFALYGAANRGSTATMSCYAGVGAYDHEVPAVVRALANRSEFVTAYTPYQPEVAQGVLQAVFEYQTLVARLSGLPIANASLYDGASSLVEALNMAHGATGRSTMAISAGVHPHWRAVAATFARGTGHHVVEVPLRDGVTDWTSLHLDDVAAVVAAYPNYVGALEDLTPARALATSHDALFIVGADPVAASVLKRAADWGADVFVGEGQVFGTALSFGGPYLGLFACAEAQVRRLPGRIVGQTVDSRGSRAFVTTLRAREQDIRREKATSNVCTNQTLMAVTAAIQLGWLGTRGLAEVATRCAQGAHYLFDELTTIGGVEAASTAPFFREFALHLPTAASDVIESLAAEEILAGVALDALDPDADDAERTLIVTVTERRTREDLDRYRQALAKAVA